VFALHPIQVESVAWLTERKNVLCGLLFFGSIYAYLRYVGMRDPDAPKTAEPKPQSPAGPDEPTEWEPWQWYTLSLALFIGAMLSKTIACSLPVCVILLLWWKGLANRKTLAPLVPYFVIGLALSIVTIRMELTNVRAVGPEWDLSIAERILIAGRALWFYVYKIFVPINLTFSYERWVLNPANVLQWLYPLGVVMVLVGLWVKRAQFGRAPLVAALWFVLTLVPALGFFNTYPMRYSFVADHFQYLSGVALMVLVVGWAASKLGESGTSDDYSRRATAVALAAVLLLVLGALTLNQSRAYKDEITLWRDTVRKNPSSWMAQHNLSAGLYRLAMVDRALELTDDANAKIGESEARVLRSLELNPSNAEAYVTYGNILLSRGKTDEALKQYEKAAELKPQMPEGWRGQGVVLMAQNKLDDAEAMFRKALDVDSRSAQSYNGLANVLAKQGRKDEAIAAFENAVKHNPGLVEARFQLAVQLHLAGRTAEAKGHYDAILKQNPYYAEAWSNLAYIIAAEGDIRTAAKFFEAALQIDPTLKRAQEGLQLAKDMIAGKFATTQRATTQATTAPASVTTQPSE
jgi:tetratricopeptide (TPR) repeat protein